MASINNKMNELIEEYKRGMEAAKEKMNGRTDQARP